MPRKKTKDCNSDSKGGLLNTTPTDTTTIPTPPPDNTIYTTLRVTPSNGDTFTHGVITGLIPVGYKDNPRFTVLLEVTINLENNTVTVTPRDRMPNPLAREIWLAESGKNFSSVFRRQ